MAIKEITGIDECIFDFIYAAAMRDATMQLAYGGKDWKKTWLWYTAKETDKVKTENKH